MTLFFHFPGMCCVHPHGLLGRPRRCPTMPHGVPSPGLGLGVHYFFFGTFSFLINSENSRIGDRFLDPRVAMEGLRPGSFLQTSFPTSDHSLCPGSLGPLLPSSRASPRPSPPTSPPLRNPQRLPASCPLSTPNTCFPISGGGRLPSKDGCELRAWGRGAYSVLCPDGHLTVLWGPGEAGREDPRETSGPVVCADPPSKSILPSPSVSAAWIMASASSSVSGAVGPLLGMVDRMYLGPGVGSGQSRGVSGWCPMVCKVLTPHFTGRETEALLERGLWAWPQCCGPGLFPAGPTSREASWGPLGGGRGTRSSAGVGVVVVDWALDPGLRTPIPSHWPLLDLIPLDETTLVLVQGLEGLADGAVQLPRGLELLHVLQELEVVEGA